MICVHVALLPSAGCKIGADINKAQILIILFRILHSSYPMHCENFSGQCGYLVPYRLLRVLGHLMHIHSAPPINVAEIRKILLNCLQCACFATVP